MENRLLHLVALVSLLLVSQTPGPAPRFDNWKVVGPGGGGTMIHPAVSPHDSNIVVEGCDMTGMYITLDGGGSWRMFNLRDVLSAVTYDPRDPKVIYVANDGLWKSTDTGHTWALLLPDPDKNTVEHMRDDHASHSFTTDDPAYRGVSRIFAVTVDPRDPSSIYVAAGGRQGKWLLHSPDGGRSWQQTSVLGSGQVFFLRIDPASSELLVGGPDGVTRPGTSPAAPGRKFLAMSAGGTGSQTIFYATAPAAWKDGRLAGAVFVSEDGGRTWEDRTGSFASVAKAASGDLPSFETVAASSSHRDLAYVGFRGLKLDNGPAFNGIARTTDRGRSWSIVRKEGDAPALNSRITWVEQRAASVWEKQKGEDYSVWFDAPVDLAVAPGNADICYATDLFRTYRTTDGGNSWETVNSVPVKGQGSWTGGQESWTTRGLDVTTCYGVHFDPFDRRRIYVSYTDIGLFRSEDGGKSWIGSTEGIPREWRNTTYWIEFDPQVKGFMWGAFGANHDLPRPKMWRRTDPARYKGGVATSRDGGENWTVTDRGINESDITHILLDPKSPVGHRTLFACGFGDGVFKSTDNGQNWTLKREGIEGRQPFAWRLARASDGVLYLVVARRSDNGEIGNQDDGALYRSSDGAEHWERVGLPEGTNGPNGLAVDPRDNRRLYLAAWGRMTPAGDEGGGVFISGDAGKTWRQALAEDQHIYDITVDPRDPAVMYACGFEHSAYRSSDRGETWARIKGFNFKWGHRVVPDPYTPGMVYITTFGGSVWYSPASGDPSAPEDIVTVLKKRK